jgi:hypothetical protein
MKIFRFRTSLTDRHQVEEISPLLKSEKSISKWNVDLEGEKAVLSVSGEDLDPAVVKKLLSQRGFSAEIFHVIAIGGHDL